MSELVLVEAAVGDPQAAQQRLELLTPMTMLDTTDEAIALAEKLVQSGAVPAEAAPDAFHIAVAAVNNVSFILTWNCRHLANAALRQRIEDVCIANGRKSPIICTPDELLGKPMNDPIVEQVREARNAYAAQFSFDLRAMGRDLQERQRASGRKVVSYQSAAVRTPPAIPSDQTPSDFSPRTTH